MRRVTRFVIAFSLILVSIIAWELVSLSGSSGLSSEGSTETHAVSQAEIPLIPQDPLDSVEQGESSDTTEQEPQAPTFDAPLQPGMNPLTYSDSFHIVGIGDSLTKGVGDRRGGGYLGQIGRQLNGDFPPGDLEVFNWGISGLRSDQLVKNLKRPELQASIQEADLIFLTIGGNDVMKVALDHMLDLTFEDFEKKEESYSENLDTILTTVYELNPNCEVVVFGIYNPFASWLDGEIQEFEEIFDNWNQVIHNIAAEYSNTIYVPIKDIFTGTDDDVYHSDHIHPNSTGYERIAERALAALTLYGLNR